MEGVGQAHRLPPAVRAHGDEALALQLLQHREAGAGLQLAEAERLAQGELVQHRVGHRLQLRQAQLDQLPQAVGGGQRPVEVPHAVPPDQRPPGAGAEDQLAQRQHVAPAGVPQLSRGGRVERAFEGHVQQRVHAQLVQVTEVDPDGALVAPPADHGLGHRLAGDHGGDAEERAGGEQAVDEPERPVVDPVGVVEQQHRHPALPGGRRQHPRAASNSPAKAPAVMASPAPRSLRASGGMRWTTGPKGISQVDGSAAARRVRRPAAAASSRHSSPSRVLPTPDGP